MPPPPPALMTANELLHVRIPEKRAELVRGKLVVREPAGLRHGRVAMDLARRLADHVDARGLGQVYAAETGFALARDPRHGSGARHRVHSRESAPRSRADGLSPPRARPRCRGPFARRPPR